MQGIEEKGGMRDRGISQLIAAHAVADANEGPRHLGAEVVGHVEEVAGVVDPGGCRGVGL